MSPVPDRSRLVVALAVVSLALCLLTGRAVASPAAWPLAGSASTLLGFGDRYAGAGDEKTHMGVDLAASEGDEVLAPASATVTFVGEVPSGADRRQKAVTIETPDGDRYTLMPLDRVTVSKGDKVVPGDTIARVAATGDGSRASTHLHVGLRRGSLYVDPLSRLVGPTAQPDPQPSVDGRTAEQPAADVASAAEGAEVPNTSRGSQTTATHLTPSMSGSATAPRPSSHTVASPTHVAAQAPAQTTARATAAASAVSAATGAATAAGGVAARVARAASAGDLTPRPLISLADVVRLARTRDRLAATIVSYLLATIASSGLIAWALRPRREGDPELAPAVASSD